MGQLATVVAIALLAVQVVGFGLLLNERDNQFFNQTSASVVFRLTEAVAVDQATNGAASRGAELDEFRAQQGMQVDGPKDRDRDRNGGRGGFRPRVHVDTINPVTPDMEPHAELAERAAEALKQEQLTVMNVSAGVGDQKIGPRAKRRMELAGDTPPDTREVLVVAAQVKQDRWISVIAPMPGVPKRAVTMLLLQSLLSYVAVLLALFWIGRRISRPLRELKGAVEGFQGTSPGEPLEEQGPSDVRSLTAAFNAMRQRMAGLMTEKDHMLGAIGHDLRTPLAALRVRLESVDDDTNRERMVATVTEMNRMLDDILSLARLGRSSEALAATDINALVEAVAADFEDLGAPVEVVEGNDRPVAEIRPALMRRAIRNLIENALKYGGSARLSVERVGKEIAIHVDDNGPGIAEDQLAEVTEPFARLEASRNRKSGGIGLGLALARGIIEEHRGRLELSNRAEGGLRATLWIVA